MQYRPLAASEIQLWREYQGYSFNATPERVDVWMNRFHIEQVRGIYHEDGTMLCNLTNIPYKLWVDGAQIGMGGIAAVAAPPEHRRGGHVGRLLTECIRESRDQGLPLSALFPFKASFYRKYGWEVACGYHAHTIPVGLLGHYRKLSTGLVTRHQPAAEDWQGICLVYTAAVKERRGYMVREHQQHYTEWVNAAWRPAETRWTAAVWRAAKGAPAEGYMLYLIEESEGKKQLWIKELIALTPAAHSGLWGYVAQHDSQVEQVHMRVPTDFPLSHLLEDYQGVKSTVRPNWMLRLIDLKAAFEQRPWPAELEGALTLRCHDQQAPWNDGSFRLSFAGGRASVKPVLEGTADLEGSVQVWAQLYAGYVRPVQAAMSNRLTVADKGALGLLTRAFAGEAFYFYEGF